MATARSVWPLPKSPATIASGTPATDKPIVDAGWNVPSPLPREIEMLSVPARATATSSLWSLLKSPTAIAEGPLAGSASGGSADGA